MAQLAFSPRSGDLMVSVFSNEELIAVAMTRAKMCLAVVGDGETIRRGGKGGFLEKWIDWLEENADLRYPESASYND